jgi:hypothetical protein
VDARALAFSMFVHVCAAAAVGTTFAPTSSRRARETAPPHGTRALVIETPDVEVELDAPKAHPNGSLAGSDRAGAMRASGSNLARAGSLGDEETSDGTTDARFGMVALVEASREIAIGTDTSWAPRPGGGADGLYAGNAIGDGMGTSGLGIGATHDGLGVGLGAIGTRGLSGDVQGSFANARTWNDRWQGDWVSYRNQHHRFPGPRIGHPTSLSPIGPLDGAVIVRIVRRDSEALLRCYRKVLETRPSLDGSLRVDFMTARDGSVVAAKDGGGSAGYDFTFVTCMTKAFESFTFPEASGYTRVAYAMDLHPR